MFNLSYEIQIRREQNSDGKRNNCKITCFRLGMKHSFSVKTARYKKPSNNWD
jgi:hypothetical protein